MNKKEAIISNLAILSWLIPLYALLLFLVSFIGFISSDNLKTSIVIFCLYIITAAIGFSFSLFAIKNKRSEGGVGLLVNLIVFLIFNPIFIFSWAHEFGPYSGRIVDAETGEPIEGVLIVARFYTEVGTLAGAVGFLADATEVMSNKNGDFEIPPHKVREFRYFHYWRENPLFDVFKPGYLSGSLYYDDKEKRNNVQKVVKLEKPHSTEKYREDSIYVGEARGHLYVYNQ